MLKDSNFGNGSDFIKVVYTVRYRDCLKVAILKKGSDFIKVVNTMRQGLPKGSDFGKGSDFTKVVNIIRQ